MKRYLGLESKSLGIGHLALALIALLLALEFASWLRMPYGKSH